MAYILSFIHVHKFYSVPGVLSLINSVEYSKTKTFTKMSRLYIIFKWETVKIDQLVCKNLTNSVTKCLSYEKRHMPNYVALHLTNLTFCYRY